MLPLLAVTAFIHVNVVPMDADRVLRDQTVLIEEGTITAMGPALAVPRGAQVIDGRGAFLSPGLADLHTHSDSAGEMKVYLASGVTTVLNMGGASTEFIGQVRPAINRGTKPGPHVYAAFLVDGSQRYGHFTVTTPDEARWVVRLAKTNGYDFIKVYNNLSPECFEALVDEGRRQHLAVVGHGITRLGLERQLDGGQVMVAHTEEFLYTVFSKREVAEIPGAIAILQRNRAFVTADLNTYETIARQWGKPQVVASLLRSEEVRYLRPESRIGWRDADYSARKGDLGENLAFLRKFTKAMSDAGVPLLAGTDAPTIPGLVPGFSLHDDLRALHRAGLSRYQALAAATRTPGEFIHRYVPGAPPFGTVTPGSRADLVLSEKNPLEDLDTLRAPLGVMAAGAWTPRAGLQAMLDEVARTYDEAR